MVNDHMGSPLNRQKHISENNIFPQLRWQAVKMCMPASKRFQVRVANAIRYIVKVCSLVTVQTVMLLAPNSFLNLSKVITQSILQIKSQSLSSHINYHYLMVKDHKKSNVRSPCSSGKFIEIPHIILINFRSYQSTKTEQ